MEIQNVNMVGLGLGYLYPESWQPYLVVELRWRAKRVWAVSLQCICLCSLRLQALRKWLIKRLLFKRSGVEWYLPLQRLRIYVLTSLL
ncbi:hypothetical protein D3C75_1267900 [compost metagenome]